jgi:hypothetical protein
MNNEFSKWYLALLRKQVEEEIQFLVTNGHDNAVIYTPCMFCVQRPNDSYVCRRMTDLRQFLSSIISHGSSKLRVQHERKRIGFEAEIFPTSESGMVNYGEKLPLLSTKL